MMLDCSTVTTVFATIVVGLLFIDLVPLQENMVCLKGYNDTSSCPEVFFSQSYHTARTKFVDAAKEAKAEMERHVVVQEDGIDYTIDTAFLRGKKSKRLLVHMTGTNGVGGYAGSAVQVKLLREWNSSRAEGASVLFVHAVNPYGMAHYRTNNENNVDLRRNYFSGEEWKSVLARDPNITGYEEIVAALMPAKAPHFIDRYVFFLRMVKSLAVNGLHAFWRAIGAGQYHRPEGICYGGREQQRSVSVVLELLAKHAAEGLEKSILFDVHSGHSKSVDTIAVRTPADAALANAIFKSSLVKDNQNAGDELSLGSLTPMDALGKNSLVLRENFGTVNEMFITRALFLENAAYHHARGSYVHGVMQSWLRDVFYPQTIQYKQTVLKKGVEAFDCAWKHLSEE